MEWLGLVDYQNFLICKTTWIIGSKPERVDFQKGQQEYLFLNTRNDNFFKKREGLIVMDIAL